MVIPMGSLTVTGYGQLHRIAISQMEYIEELQKEIATLKEEISNLKAQKLTKDCNETQTP